MQKNFDVQITQYIPANANSVSIEASLETVLECVAAESEIDSGEITIDEQTVKLTFKGDSVNNIRNKNVTLNLTVKFEDGVTFEELISLYGNPANVPIKATV